MGESFFMVEGEAAWFELELLLNAGEEVLFFWGRGTICDRGRQIFFLIQR